MKVKVCPVRMSPQDWDQVDRRALFDIVMTNNTAINHRLFVLKLSSMFALISVTFSTESHILRAGKQLYHFFICVFVYTGVLSQHAPGDPHSDNKTLQGKRKETEETNGGWGAGCVYYLLYYFECIQLWNTSKLLH